MSLACVLLLGCFPGFLLSVFMTEGFSLPHPRSSSLFKMVKVTLDCEGVWFNLRSCASGSPGRVNCVWVGMQVYGRLRGHCWTPPYTLLASRVFINFLALGCHLLVGKKGSLLQSINATSVTPPWQLLCFGSQWIFPLESSSLIF